MPPKPYSSTILPLQSSLSLQNTFIVQSYITSNFIMVIFISVLSVSDLIRVHICTPHVLMLSTYFYDPFTEILFKVLSTVLLWVRFYLYIIKKINLLAIILFLRVKH